MKKTHKRILALILAFAMAFSSLVYVGATDGDADEITLAEEVISGTSIDLEDETEEETRDDNYIWDLTTNGGCESLAIQSTSGTLYSDLGIYGEIIVDATNGKFDNSYNASWAQVNDGTVIYVPAAVGSVITFTSYYEGTATTDGGNSFSGGTEYTVTSADLTEVDGVNYAALTFSGVSYVSVITEDNTNATEGSGDSGSSGGSGDEETTAPEKGATYSADFKAASDMSADGWESEDGIFQVIGCTYNGSQHGIVANPGAMILVSVAGDATFTWTTCMYSSSSAYFTVLDGEGTTIDDNIALLVDNSADGATFTYKYKGGADVLTFLVSGSGSSYIHSVTVSNAAEATGVGENFEFWFDDYAAEKGVTEIEQQTFEYADSTLTILGYTDSNYTDGLARYKVKYSDLERAGRTGVNAWLAGNRNADCNNLNYIPTEKGSGTETVFTPAEAGMFITYFSSGSFLRAWTFTNAGNRVGYADSETAADSYAIEVEPGYTYVLSTTGKTNNCAYCGYAYIINEEVTVNLDWTEETAGAYDDIHITFTDADLGTETAEITFGTPSVTLLKGHTYALSTDDGGVAALVDDEDSFTADGSDVTIAMTDVPDETLTGAFLNPDGSEVEDSSLVESLTFVNMKNGVEYSADINADGTYSCVLKPGNYNASVVAGSYTTYDRAEVVSGEDNTDDIYLESLISDEYSLPVEAVAASSALTFTGSVAYNNDQSVHVTAGTTITVPVSGVQKVTVTGWYAGTWNINGESEASANSTDNGNYSSVASSVYTTDGTETEVTVNMVETGYLYMIYVEDVYTEWNANISVPGDFDTLKEAVAYIRNNSLRPEGEEGRAYITLTADLQEQIVFDADYITLLGDGHEISWYYGQTCSYYSVDSNGLYSDSLFYDKYEKTEASGSLWGGVAIIEADMFRAENTIFKNTFNYYVTEKEVEDGAYQTQGSLGLRQLDSAVGNYAYKERSNAFYVGDPNNTVKDIYVELYNCQVLSSQDTFGRNGSTDNGIKVYAKDCVIGGNVDYICGEFTALFDNCELQWKTYESSSSSNSAIGYITAAKTNPYIFRNCEVTVDDETISGVKGGYGRTWGDGSTAYFVNTETNGYINTTTGWGEMNSGDGASAVFCEYNNTNNGEVFYTVPSFDSSYVTEITDATVINNLTTDDIITAYLSNWTPYYYDAELAEDDTTETTTETDTTTETTTEDSGSSGSDEDETRAESYVWNLGAANGCEVVDQLQGEGGTTTLYSSLGTYGTLIVDATNGKFNNANRGSAGEGDEWAQVNDGTIIYVPAAAGSVITFTSYAAGTASTTGGSSFTSDEAYTVTESDLTEIDGVTYAALTFSGVQYVSVITEDNSGVVEPEDTGNGVRGDIDQNGKLTANDAACLLLYVQGGYVQNEERNVSKYIADVAIEGDTEITAADAALILAKVLNPSVEFKAVEGEESGESGGDDDEEETIVGSSFTWWFDEVNNGGSVAVGDYNAGEDEDGNYAALITLIPCLEKESYTSWSKYTSYSYTYTDGVTHYGYKMGERPSSYSTLPTTGNAIVYTANSSGMLTVYVYVNSGRNHAIYDYGVGGTSSSTELLRSDAPDSSQNMALTVSVEAGHVYAIGPVGTNGNYVYGLKFLINEPVETALSFSKANADEFVTDTDTISIYFTDTDSGEVITAATTDTAVTLNKGHTYTVSTSDGGVDAAFSTGDETITSDGSALSIVLTQLPEETLTGEITGSATDASVVSSITFTNMTYDTISYTFSAADAVDVSAGTYSVSLYPGEYNTSVVTTDGSFTNDRVSVVAGGTNENEIYLEYEEVTPDPIAYVSEISVGEGGDYATFKEALAAIGVMTDRPEGEDGRVTINLLSDIQEQVYMNQNYVTLKGNGHEVNWYYGDTGGTTYYYSIDPSTGLYSESLFRDKYSYTQPASSFWGGVMIVMGDYFKAENVDFKNTYNYYVPAKEMEDLAGGDKGLKRLAGENVRDKNMRERGTALAVNGNYSEYYKCGVYSSQDALGWNGTLSNYTYFQDCVIGGNTDYICGAGTMVFDNCELRWFTEENMDGLGYITAPKSNPYIFRNCEITEDSYKTPSKNYGTYGRPWASDATCYYVQCETNGYISDAGWTNMSSNTAANANFYEYQNTKNGSAFKTSIGKQVTDAQTINDLTTDDLIKVYLNDWIPTYYVSVGEGEGTVETTTEGPTEATTSYECDLSYGDDFTGFLKSSDNGADVDLAYSSEDGVYGNTSAMIQIVGKAVALPLEAPITSGKVTVTADFLRTDTAEAGRTFRIYFENEVDESTAYDSVKDTIIYHLMDVASTVYVNASNVSANSAAGTSLGATLEDGVWYRIEITADLDEGTSTTAIYKHGSDGTYTTDDTNLVLVGSETSADLLAPDNNGGSFVQQIRFVKTASATSYWDNITVKTEASSTAAE